MLCFSYHFLYPGHHTSWNRATINHSILARKHLHWVCDAVEFSPCLLIRACLPDNVSCPRDSGFLFLCCSVFAEYPKGKASVALDDDALLFWWHSLYWLDYEPFANKDLWGTYGNGWLFLPLSDKCGRLGRKQSCVWWLLLFIVSGLMNSSFFGFFFCIRFLSF